MLNISELSPAKEQNVFDESELTSPEFRTLGRMILSMERNFNARMDSMDSRMDSMDSRMSSMESDIKYLKDNVLAADDLDALLNVTAMRRSLVMPFSHVQSLMENSVSLDSIVGKKFT